MIINPVNLVHALDAINSSKITDKYMKKHLTPAQYKEYKQAKLGIKVPNPSIIIIN